MDAAYSVWKILPINGLNLLVFLETWQRFLKCANVLKKNKHWRNLQNWQNCYQAQNWAQVCPVSADHPWDSCCCFVGIHLCEIRLMRSVIRAHVGQWALEYWQRTIACSGACLAETWRELRVGVSAEGLYRSGIWCVCSLPMFRWGRPKIGRERRWS